MKETIIRQYRKRPVIIEAVQLDNINGPCVVQWIGEDKAKMNLESYEAWTLGKAPPIFSVTICTLEGNMKAMPGDYIIKGVHGEFYPCKPDIFEKTYEAVEPPKEKEQNSEDRYLEEMKRAIEISKNDEEQGHWLADTILCNFLKHLGYTEIVNEFEKVQKWYA